LSLSLRRQDTVEALMEDEGPAPMELNGVTLSVYVWPQARRANPKRSLTVVPTTTPFRASL
jgi:hypothetical protein